MKMMNYVRDQRNNHNNLGKNACKSSEAEFKSQSELSEDTKIVLSSTTGLVTI